jgi:hypothetical protein
MSIGSPGDAFALKNSGLDAFLFAEVGIEQNGSPLTVLSTLARLGRDPWAQAAEWARMPPAAIIAGLTQSIVQMPLCPRALADARATAGRLALLLPSQSGTTGRIGTAGQTASRVIEEFKVPKWLPLVVFCVMMGLTIVVGTLAAPAPPQAPVAQSAPFNR